MTWGEKMIIEENVKKVYKSILEKKSILLPLFKSQYCQIICFVNENGGIEFKIFQNNKPLMCFGRDSIDDRYLKSIGHFFNLINNMILELTEFFNLF
jgi:hypothetical protein